MKFLTYFYGDVKSYGCLLDSCNILDIPSLKNTSLPNNLNEFLIDFNENILNLSKVIKLNKFNAINVNKVKIDALIKPNSFRDFYAFRKHVEAGRKNRGLAMIKEYDEFPVFYFSNHNSVVGPGDICLFREQLSKLDFELEVAIIISKIGENIKAKDAYKYVAGFTILNDWSSRQVQMKEMKLNLGPAKGKDFASSIGPYLVTLDEIRDKSVGKIENLIFDLDMKAYLNDRLVSNDNFKNITWSFPEMIERASYGTKLFPGDLIGSGTCATGCLLELNQTNKTNIWLKNGDNIKLSIEKLGTLENTIKSID